eukprot:10254564-Lingulodinium_polyedra.AAC.1
MQRGERLLTWPRKARREDGDDFAWPTKNADRMVISPWLNTNTTRILVVYLATRSLRFVLGQIKRSKEATLNAS